MNICSHGIALCDRGQDRLRCPTFHGEAVPSSEKVFGQKPTTFRDEPEFLFFEDRIRVIRINGQESYHSHDCHEIICIRQIYDDGYIRVVH